MNQSTKSFRKFIILWSGELISAIGNGLTAFGLSVYVYQLTGKASAMALIALLAFLPPLFFASFAGVLADRYDRRTLMILGDSLSVIGLAYILICLHSGNVQLWQIGLGVTISSVFSTLMDPAYKATVTDLLTQEQYTRASGLVQVAGSAKFLISPVLAGCLLAAYGIQILLMLDIATFFITVFTTLVVRKTMIPKKVPAKKASILTEVKEGFLELTKSKGVFVLTVLTVLISFFMGFIQTLTTPVILAFQGSAVLGTIQTIMALGMFFSGLFLGLIRIRTSYVKILSLSLLCSGLSMVGFGSRENIFIISFFGFLFFATLPFANACMDFLIRTGTDNEIQGRVWALMEILSQLGYVIAYAVSGLLADYLFRPMLLANGLLAKNIGKMIGTGEGRGSAFLIILSGILMCLTSVILYNLKSIKGLEKQK